MGSPFACLFSVDAMIPLAETAFYAPISTATSSGHSRQGGVIPNFISSAATSSLPRRSSISARRPWREGVALNRIDVAAVCLAGQHPPASREQYVPRRDSIRERLFPAGQQRIVPLLIEKVIVSPNDLEVRFRPDGIEVLALELQPRPEPADETVEEAVA
jgi:hypothetical protein